MRYTTTIDGVSEIYHLWRGGHTMSIYSDFIILVEKLEKKDRAFIKALLREIEADNITLQEIAKKLDDFLNDTE